jgi:IS30 family transposase
MPRKRIFTPYNLFRIQQMAEDGCSTIEIANSIGSTPGSVRVVCCRHKIKFGRRGRKSITNAVSKPVRRSSEQSIAVHLPTSISTEFHRRAGELQIPVSVLAAKLLSAIVISNIYEAVLDDEDAAPYHASLAAERRP